MNLQVAWIYVVQKCCTPVSDFSRKSIRRFSISSTQQAPGNVGGSGRVATVTSIEHHHHHPSSAVGVQAAAALRNGGLASSVTDGDDDQRATLILTPDEKSVVIIQGEAGSPPSQDLHMSSGNDRSCLSPRTEDQPEPAGVSGSSTGGSQPNEVRVSVRRKGDCRRFQLQPSKPPTIATFSCSKLNINSALYGASLPVHNTQAVHGASSNSLSAGGYTASTVLGNGGVSYVQTHDQAKNFKGKRKNFGGEELIV